ncbi:hypothetical protein [Streptomyces sp. NPDC048521]
MEEQAGKLGFLTTHARVLLVLARDLAAAFATSPRPATSPNAPH